MPDIRTEIAGVRPQGDDHRRIMTNPECTPTPFASMRFGAVATAVLRVPESQGPGTALPEHGTHRLTVIFPDRGQREGEGKFGGLAVCKRV